MLDRLLGGDIEVELAVADSQFEFETVFSSLRAKGISNIIAWRRLEGRDNPPGVLTVKDRIDVEGPVQLVCLKICLHPEQEICQLIEAGFEYLCNYSSKKMHVALAANLLVHRIF